MKKRRLIYGTLICLFAVTFSGCKGKTKPEEKNDRGMITGVTKEQLVQRGNYLVTTIGCNDCHSPKTWGAQGPELVKTLMLSGYPAETKLPIIDKKNMDQKWLLFSTDFTAAVGPWGVSFAANITSDPSGIGSWPEENFIRAMKQGKFKGVEGGRTLLPPMPWQNFAGMTDDDVKAIYAFLITTTPVHNVVPTAIAAEDIK